MSEQTIEIDCAPGGRPDHLYPGVIEGTGLGSREPVSRTFGNWVWDYSDVSKETWEVAQPILKQRITALYNQGRIRYAKWAGHTTILQDALLLVQRDRQLIADKILLFRDSTAIGDLNRCENTDYFKEADPRQPPTNWVARPLIGARV